MLKKIWNGQYSLKKTYWLYGNIIPAIFFMVILATALIFQKEPLNAILNLKFVPQLFYQKLILSVLIILFFIYSVITTVGIWRSANNYLGNKIWPVLAKISIILAFIYYIKDFKKFFF